MKLACDCRRGLIPAVLFALAALGLGEACDGTVSGGQRRPLPRESQAEEPSLGAVGSGGAAGGVQPGAAASAGEGQEETPRVGDFQNAPGSAVDAGEAASVAPDAAVDTGGLGDAGAPEGDAGAAQAECGGAVATLEPTVVDACKAVFSHCEPAQSSEHLSGRAVVSSTCVAPSRRWVSAQDIYRRFDAACGRCHTPPNQPSDKNGTWVLGQSDVLRDERFGPASIERIVSTDSERIMPPDADPTRPRRPTVETLLELLREWTARGRPVGFWQEEADGGTSGSAYRYQAAVRQALTNIGSCVPEPELVGCASSAAAAHPTVAALDAKFAALPSYPAGLGALPALLSDTDLFTLDSRELAQYGVVSYAPTYTLFSDDAQKMRYVRLPHGTKLRYDAATQDFEIPPNTRFYKTFLRAVGQRRVLSPDGQPRTETQYRKIETRIIVVRPDELVDGVWQPRSVFGTYRWSLDESRAELVGLADAERYQDGTLFKDQLFSYIQDERAAEALGLDPDSAEDIGVAVTIDAAKGTVPREQLLTHTYGLPGRDRCVQCHMGSSSKSFVLGFNPFQVDRRRTGTGGTYEVAGESELSQLQRFVEYGLVEGVAVSEMGDPTFKLEDSQRTSSGNLAGTTRAPRNDYELLAQGYMLGNCAFCHNPRGFPTVQNPALRDVMDFYPRPDPALGQRGGGIFQYPVDTLSPRTARGADQKWKFPYIAPYLYDYAAFESEPSSRLTVVRDGQEQFDAYVLAPWRSLIFRNVDTPFTYSADSAIHPHMPLSVPGYDCRARNIFAQWMLSIPVESAAEAETEYPFQVLPSVAWREVTAADGAERLARAREEAAQRIEDYMNASPRRPGPGETAGSVGRGGFCPKGVDIVDAEVMRGERLTPASRPQRFARVPDVYAMPPADGVQWQDGVPDRPHWLDRDLTQAAGAWRPRNSEWRAFLGPDATYTVASPNVRGLSKPDVEALRAELDSTNRQSRRVFDLTRTLRYSEAIQKFALTPLAYGWWKSREGGHAPGREASCPRALAEAPTVRNLANGEEPAWLRSADHVPPTAKLYVAPPGQVLFDLICQNCHGESADGQSLLASTLAELTGGKSRVANLRDGLFGGGGLNGEREFGSEELAARYLVWMGLGGTAAQIPQAVLARVGNTRPLGVDRLSNANAQATANMLSNAVGFCQDVVLPRASRRFDMVRGRRVYTNTLVGANADQEVWEQVCAIDNPAPIKRVTCSLVTGRVECTMGQFGGSHFAFWATEAATGAPLVAIGAGPQAAPQYFGDHRGRVTRGLTTDNLGPWCVARPREATPAETAELTSLLDRLWSERGDGAPIPYCPAELEEPLTLSTLSVGNPPEDDERFMRWATRGAMNVGMSVFAYLQGVAEGHVAPQLPYDACALGEGAE